MPDESTVPEHRHEPPALGDAPLLVIVLVPAILLGIGYLFVRIADAIVQAISPDQDYGPFEAVYCTYYRLQQPIPAGKRVRIEVEGNETTSTPGAIDIYVTPTGRPTPPAGNPTPGVTFTGDGDLTIGGTGNLTIHLKTDTPPPTIRIWFEDP